MEEQQFYQAVERNIDIRSDFDKILLFLAREEPRSIDSSTAYSPRRASGYPWLSTYADEELLSFSADQNLLSQPNLPMISMPSSQLSLQRDLLFSPFTSDLIATSSILEDMHGQGVFFQEENSAHFCSGYNSSIQDNISYCDNHHMRHLRINQTDGLQYSGQLQLVSPAPHQDSSASLSYGSFLPSGMFQSSNKFLLADGAGGGGGGGGGDGCGGGGGGSGVLATPNSSLSSSCSEEVVDEESSCHPNPSSLLDEHTTVAGSKRKLAAGMTISEENLASDVADNKKLQDKPQAKKGKKRLREPRYAIQTRSEKDVLEDGYKWRKYGQKTVKNTPHPRSYYRCTYNKCSVKKTVERSCEDSGLVITTYEGTHVHPSPAAIRAPATQSQFLDTIFSRQLYSHNLSSDDHNIGFELAKQIRSAGAFQLPAQLEKNIPEDMIPSTLRIM